MPAYINGTKIKGMYFEGKAVTKAYSNGNLVFSTGNSGWVMGADLTMTVRSNDNNSVAGTLVFNRFDYYEGADIKQTYYQLSTRSLSRASDGVVTLTFAPGTTITFVGPAQTFAEYETTSDGKITLSAQELYYIYQIKSPTLLNLGTALTVTSYYLLTVQDMAISKLGTNLNVATGWAIANNRASRMAVTTSFSMDPVSLAVPGDGYWPVYAIANAGTEATVSTITCATNAHKDYDGKNIRHLGWVTISGGAISSVTPVYTATGSGLSNAISGTTLNISPGYAVDTDGMKVYIPQSTLYTFDDMVAAAKDTTTTTKGSKVTLVDNETSGSIGSTNTQTVLQGGYYQLLDSNKHAQAPGPCELHYRYRYSLQTNSQYLLYSGTSTSNLYYTDKTSSTSERTLDIPAGTTIYNIRATYKEASFTGKKSWTSVAKVYYYPIVTTTTQGTTQTRTLYAKVVRNQNDDGITVTTQTTSGDSTPFISYVKLGTITVARNASTGTFAQ